jgi:CBS domain-containing protein
MTAKDPQARQPVTKCPSCGAENLLGADRCGQCLHSLMTVDLPKAKQGEKMQEVMMTAPIGGLLTGKDLLVASTTDTIQKIVKIFQKEEKDCVLVFSKKKLVGILSQRDILHRVAGRHKDLSKVTVAAVMTPNPEYVRAEDPIAFVVNKMALGGFRHVPVLDAAGQPLSIITIRDVLRYIGRRHAA